MKFNGKGKIRLLRDFPAVNLRMGDSLTVYKYKNCFDETTSIQPRTYLKFIPEDVKELSNDAKKYAFKVFIGSSYCVDSSCIGIMRVTEDSVDEAYNVMLDIPYSIELIEESEDE